MALQDLTPQLRTRMSRVERVVGLFVFLATLLMIAGFAHYLATAGKKRGWFIHKVPYYCYAKDATGLKPGDTVRLLGRAIGRILEVETNPLDTWFVDNQYNVFIRFEIWEPYFGYLTHDSQVRIVSADFLGARSLEIVPGDQATGIATVFTQRGNWEATRVLHPKRTNDQQTLPLRELHTVDKGFWLTNVNELPAMSAHVEGIVRTAAESLPRITRRTEEVLAHTALATSNAHVALAQLQPALTQLQTLSARLANEEGVIGRMTLSSNLNRQVEGTLAGMESTLTNTTALIRTSETQLQELTRRIAITLDAVSGVTSNLNSQVAANGLFLGEVSSLIVNADDMVQGLKQHWLLRPAFRTPTNAPLESTVLPSLDGPPR